MCAACGKSANKITIYQRLFIGWMDGACAMSGICVAVMVLVFHGNRMRQE